MADLYATPGKEPRLHIEGDEFRTIFYDGTEEVFSSLAFKGRLSLRDIRRYCGAFLHKRMIDVPLAENEMPDVLNRASIPVGVVPAVSVIKMMKSEHADFLTEHGGLRLGSIEYYRRHENPEVKTVWKAT